MLKCPLRQMKAQNFEIWELKPVRAQVQEMGTW